jgi:hypothetical protein
MVHTVTKVIRLVWEELRKSLQKFIQLMSNSELYQAISILHF